MKYFVLLFLVLVVSKVDAQVHTVIEGYIAQLPEKTKIFIVPFELNTNDQRQYEWRDSAVSLDGRFRFDINKPYEGIYELRITRELSNAGKLLPVYFRNEKIKIVSETENFAKVTISGSGMSDDYNRYLVSMEQNNFLDSLRSALLRSREVENAKVYDTVVAAKARTTVLSLYERRKDLTKNWIQQNPGSEISPVLIHYYLSSLSMPQLDSMMQRIQPEAKQTFIAKNLEAQVVAYAATALGKQAPDFTLKNVKGENISLADFRGKIVLLDFWASWCVPCRAENPKLLAMYEKYKNKKFEVLSVSLDDKHDKWIKAIEEDKLSWKHASDLAGWDSEAGRLYNVTSVPQNFLIDENGKILKKNVSIAKLDEGLAKIFEK